MQAIELGQFTSLFEIGFALHIALAFLDRIHEKELPARLKQISNRAKALELFQKEISPSPVSDKQQSAISELHLAYRTIDAPIWPKYNNYVVDRVFALAQDIKGQIKVLRRILNVITFLSVLVLLYSVTILFMIGLEADLVTSLDPMTASIIVLIQLLPLPVAAVIFFFVARRMSHEVDRKIRGLSELQLMLSEPDTTPTKYATIEEVYQRDRHRNRFHHD